jgi:cysteinyl-tRNA synthetase
MLVRYLEYLGYSVERVLNFTDIEDKAVEEAEKEGMDVKDLTEMVAQRFYHETELLRIKPPAYNPRSSTSVDQAVMLIKALLKKKIAYWYGEDVFYDPLKYKGFGRLYGLDIKKWPEKKRRFRKDTYQGMRWNLGDFILWHGCREGEKVCFDKELGMGRPSWNVQDPAMATKYLGFEIDIHCGGIDNLYRHHDYNLAVVEGVSGRKFARYWLHGEHLLLEGKKMSKSSGRVVYLEDLVDKGFTPEHVRFYLIYGHYRNRMNMTESGFRTEARKLDEMRDLVNKIMKSADIKRSTKESKGLVEGLTTDFEDYMNSDMDVRGAIDSVHENLKKILDLKNRQGLSNPACARVMEKLEKIDTVLQVLLI